PLGGHGAGGREARDLLRRHSLQLAPEPGELRRRQPFSLYALGALEVRLREARTAGAAAAREVRRLRRLPADGAASAPRVRLGLADVPLQRRAARPVPDPRAPRRHPYAAHLVPV